MLKYALIKYKWNYDSIFSTLELFELDFLNILSKCSDNHNWLNIENTIENASSNSEVDYLFYIRAYFSVLSFLVLIY